MATHIFDIDGTIVNYHTNQWIDGAKELLIRLFQEGHDIVFITMRGIQDNNTLWSVENTKNIILKQLDDLGIKYYILFGMQSPRIIHDDTQAIVDFRKTNQKYL